MKIIIIITIVSFFLISHFIVYVYGVIHGGKGIWDKISNTEKERLKRVSEENNDNK